MYLHLRRKRPRTRAPRLTRACSLRMYKTQFKRWGMRKYLSHRELLMAQMRAVARADDAEDVGPSDQNGAYLAPSAAFQQLNMDDEQKPIPATTSQTVMNVGPRHPRQLWGMSRSANPIPIRMEAPAYLRLPEECMYMIRNYVQGASGAKSWSLALNSSASESLLWMNRLGLGRQLVSSGCFAQGFAMINLCFDQYKGHMLESAPWLIFTTFLGAFDLAKADPRLGNSFIRFAHQLSNINVRNSNPLHRIFSILNQAGPTGAMVNGVGALECFLAQMGQHAAPTDLIMLQSLMRVYERLPQNALITFHVADDTLQSIIYQLKNGPFKEDVLVDIRNTKTGLKHAVVCFRQPNIIQDKVWNGKEVEQDVLEAGLLEESHKDLIEISHKDDSLSEWLADGLARYSVLELQSANYSIIATWDDLEACSRACGDQDALRQLHAVFPILKAGHIDMLRNAA